MGTGVARTLHLVGLTHADFGGISTIHLRPKRHSRETFCEEIHAMPYVKDRPLFIPQKVSAWVSSCLLRLRLRLGPVWI